MSPASYPNYTGRHAEEAIFSPAGFTVCFTACFRRVGATGASPPPAAVVLCYQRSLR